MPQLDMLSWFNQVFTTLLVIFFFYLLLSLLFLPAVTSIIKGRYKLQNFRKYSVQFSNLQQNLLVQDTQHSLSVLFFTNLFVINTYYQPLFEPQFMKNLTKTSYLGCENTEHNELQNLYCHKTQMAFIQNAN